MKVKGYVAAQYQAHLRKFEFQLWPVKPSGGAFSAIQPVEVEIDEPPEDALISGTVEAWRKEQQRIQAEAEAKCTQLDRQINELLCIEYKPEAA